MRRIIVGMLCVVLVLMSACGGGGSSGEDETIPAAPSAVSVMAGRGHVSGQTGNYALIRWDNVSGATSYTLYYGASASINTSSSSVSGVTSPYVFSNANIRAGAYYYFALTAVNANGESDLSAIKRMAVLLPQTGQTTRYADNDDGDLEEGAAWPVTRFIDNGDQTVTDTLTGLMWQKYPTDIIPRSNWSTAFGFCSDSDIGTHTDWRIPNLRELQSLLDYSVYPMAVDSTAFLSLPGLPNTDYWTSTTYSSTTTSAWYVDMYTGQPGVDDKATGSNWVWAVRDDIGPATAEVARTGQTPTVPLNVTGIAGADGTLQNGVIWPTPRFVDNGDGTVTDILTGLMWVKDATLVDLGDWETVLNDIADLPTGDHHDWRMPNVRELESLLDMSQDSPCLPSGYPFTHMGTGDIYWTSTTYAGDPGNSAWCIDLSDGSILTAAIGSSLYVLPVRNTQ